MVTKILHYYMVGDFYIFKHLQQIRQWLSSLDDIFITTERFYVFIEIVLIVYYEVRYKCF